MNKSLCTLRDQQAKVSRLTRTYKKQLLADKGCFLEDLTEAMDDRDGWRERTKKICGGSLTWWYWIYFDNNNK